MLRRGALPLSHFRDLLTVFWQVLTNSYFQLSFEVVRTETDGEKTVLYKSEPMKNGPRMVWKAFTLPCQDVAEEAMRLSSITSTLSNFPNCFMHPLSLYRASVSILSANFLKEAIGRRHKYGELSH